MKQVRLALLGSGGSGKTVFLGMLCELLTRRSEGLQVVERDRATIESRQRIVDSLLRCQFPDSTSVVPSDWDWLFLGIRRDAAEGLDVVIPDFPGNVLIEEIDRPTTFPTIRAYLQQCDAILLLLDSSRAGRGERGEDFQMMKALTYMHELHQQANGGSAKASDMPVAVVLTKVDECAAALDEPRKFVQTQTPGVWHHCTERFPNHAVFACQVAGMASYQLRNGHTHCHFPLRIEPLGVPDPFDWIFARLTDKRL